jgi:hypothetical protein
MRNEFALGQKSHGKFAAEIAGRAATGLLTVIPAREANYGAQERPRFDALASPRNAGGH